MLVSMPSLYQCLRHPDRHRLCGVLSVLGPLEGTDRRDRTTSGPHCARANAGARTSVPPPGKFPLRARPMVKSCGFPKPKSRLSIASSPANCPEINDFENVPVAAAKSHRLAMRMETRDQRDPLGAGNWKWRKRRKETSLPLLFTFEAAQVNHENSSQPFRARPCHPKRSEGGMATVIFIACWPS